MKTDLFSKQAAVYSSFRPKYPEALYRFLADECEERKWVWDCATGNGQAALDLSRHFDRVIATDLSASQIENATKAPNVEYRVLPAENPLEADDDSFDLVTVAQAIHWFDLEKFYPEVKRVLKPAGIFATWAYGFHSPIHPEIDPILHDFYFGKLGPYWKPNNQLIVDGYRDLAFPFREITTPKLALRVDWSLADLMGYFRSWSGTQLYRDRHGVDPTIELETRIAPFWGNPSEKRALSWDLIFRAGRK